MRPISITYEHKTANGNWSMWTALATTGEEYERIVNILHQNKDEYRVVEVKHI